MYGIKVFFDEEKKDWLWLMDSTASYNGNLFILKFDSYDEAEEYAKTIQTMSTRIEKLIPIDVDTDYEMVYNTYTKQLRDF
jgi:hypothetical protein